MFKDEGKIRWRVNLAAGLQHCYVKAE